MGQLVQRIDLGDSFSFRAGGGSPGCQCAIPRMPAREAKQRRRGAVRAVARNAGVKEGNGGVCAIPIDPSTATDSWEGSRGGPSAQK